MKLLAKASSEIKPFGLVKLSATCLGVARRAKTGADSSGDEIAAARRNEIVPERLNEIHACA